MLKNRLFLWKRLVAVMACVLTLSGVSFASSDTVQDRSLPSFRVTSLHQWVVDRMVTWAPPGLSYVKEAKESEEEGRRRYEDIANDIMTVTYDPAERPIFQGANGRAMTTALLTSIAFYESAYRKDVDTGVGPKAQGDSGKSWCLMQVKLGTLEKDTGRTKLRVVVGPNGGLRFVSSEREPGYATAWGGEDLVQDRTKCFRVALRIARLSFGSCSKLGVQDRLSMYASGRCEVGEDASRRRVSRAQQWLWKSRPPMLDAQALDLLWSDIPVPPQGEGAFLFFGAPKDIVQTFFI
jgi:hypothetical protein